MEEILKEILGELKEFKTQTNERLNGIDNRLEAIESQQSENIQLIKALIHASEVHKADKDNLTHAVARVEGEVKELRNDLSTIEAVTAKNWKDIVNLKAAR